MNIGSVLAGAVANVLPGVGGAAGKPPSAPIAGARPAAVASGGPSVAGRLRAAGSTASQRHAEQLGGILTRLARGALSTSSSASKSSSATSPSSSSGALAFLKDGRLSVEERLARLMVHLSDKYEKQLEQKLQQYANLEEGKATSTSGSAKAKSGGGTASLKEGVSALFSKAGVGKLLGSATVQKLVGQVAGPVLAGAATALGMPFLAAPLLKAGPLLGSVLAGAASAAGSGAASGSKATSTSTSKGSSGSSSSSAPSAPSEKRLMTEIQILQEKQKEMFSLVSNVLRSMHDTKMAVIGNVR